MFRLRYHLALTLLITTSLFVSAWFTLAHPTSSRKPAIPITKDVTSKLNKLGKPFDKQGYAANVWDMQLFGSKIYLGYGNSSNLGPARNAGPIPIYYLDPKTNRFSSPESVVSAASGGYIRSSSERTVSKKAVDEEQIDLFRVLNGELYIPGHDPRGEGWELGNFYRLEKETWKKYRTIPQGIHVYDMAYYRGRLFAALGAEQADVVMSEDRGITWTKVGTVPFHPGRAYTLFSLDGKLYASGSMYAIQNWTKILQIDERFQVSEAIFPVDKMIADYEVRENPMVKLFRTTAYKDQLLYLVGEVHNDHQALHNSAYWAESLTSVTKLPLPARTYPSDLLVRDSKAYVLAYTKLKKDQYRNTVYRITESKKLTEVFSFTSSSYARSFEEYQGDFYFGLGCDADEITREVGEILRVPKGSYPSP